MNYPNKKQTSNTLQKLRTNSNRGMSLEEDINLTNEYYLAHDIAVIHKKPTPIQVVDVSYPSREKCMITKAFYKVPSTTDYNGIYKGKYIDFEAKETKSKTSFPLSNIHDHQLKHIEGVIRHKGYSFLIILINEEYYLLSGEKLLQFIHNNNRKSIPYTYIKENGIKIDLTIKPVLDYLNAVDILIKERIK